MGSNNRVVQLQVNIAGDTAASLRRWAAYHDVSITEQVRRCIKLMDFVEEQAKAGAQLAVFDTNTGTAHLVEIQWQD